MRPVLNELDLRMIPWTVYPFDKSSSVKYEPSWPVIPVTSAFFISLFARCGSFGTSEKDAFVDLTGMDIPVLVYNGHANSFIALAFQILATLGIPRCQGQICGDVIGFQIDRALQFIERTVALSQDIIRAGQVFSRKGKVRIDFKKLSIVFENCLMKIDVRFDPRGKRSHQ